MKKKNQVADTFNSVIEKNERKGIRELTPEEIELVSGSHSTGYFSAEGASVGGSIGYLVGGGKGAAVGTLVGGYGGAAMSAQASAIGANVKAGIAAGGIGI